MAQHLLDRGDAADHHPVRVQRALGLAGGPRRIDQQRGVFGARIDGGEVVGRRSKQAVPVEEFRPVRARSDHDHGLEVRQAVAHGQHLGKLAHIGDHRLGLGIGQTKLERLLAEQGEERQHDGAHAVAGEMAERELGALAQEHADTIARRDALGHEPIGQPRAGGQQLAERPGAHTAVGVLHDHRQCVSGMALAHRSPDIEALGLRPAELAHRLLVGDAARDHVRGLRG